MRVIGISGSDGCGKSTLAEAIIHRAGDRFHPVRVPFAEQLRHEVRNLLADDVDVWQKPTPPWLRSLLVGWGGYKRSINPDYWVEAWQGLLQFWGTRQTESELLVVVDDVRYRNELSAVQHLGGTVLYLDDAGQPDHTLGHELVEVRSMADLGFTINSKAKMWADADQVLEALEL